MSGGPEDSIPAGSPGAFLQDDLAIREPEPSFPMEIGPDASEGSPSSSNPDETLFDDEMNTVNPEAALPDEITALKSRATTKKRVTLPKEILDLGNEALREHIRANSRELYGDEAKSKQVDAVAALVHDRHTFVLAGTGFGKTRIAEMYHNLFQPDQKSIVLVLNPLDSLGDNQVNEKKSVGASHKKISAVNLKKGVLDKTMAKQIIAGEFEFVYLSPEALLNNPIFRDIYFDTNFQSRLSLVVVDEAHMVYVWGLVASGESKGLNSHSRHGERGVFRPGYGELAARLMANNGTPLLMMSATCRPIAIRKILESFKLNMDMVEFVRAELTRPEIRILRINMKYSLASSDDLAGLYSSQEQTPDSEIIPTLIYSTTKNLTGQVLEVLNRARESHHGEDDPFSKFARRYHSATGDLDKSDVINDFTNGVFPVVSSTMALGLGQNWKRVRSVIHMGRGDPASICQMLGRCGRDGKPGLAIMFVEPNRKNGKNCVADFTNVKFQNDDDRMDALAITPVCLRIAFSLDNSLGYVPLSVDDPNYKKEAARETEKEFAECFCSNCKPESSQWLINNMKRATIKNFDSLISDLREDIPELNPIRRSCSVQTNKVVWVEESGEKPLEESLEMFSKDLVGYFNRLFESVMKNMATYPPSAYFCIKQARRISKNIGQLTIDNIEELIGGEMLPGQMSMLIKHIELFRSGELFKCVAQQQEEAETRLNLTAERLRLARETEENERIEKQKAIHVAAALKRAETAERVAKNAERKRVAKEAKFVESEKKRAKRDSDMAILQELKAQAQAASELSRSQDAVGPTPSTSGAVNGSIDPSLL
ncbi:uncharacterized protein PGTG_08538 [Puccinia graminis f. sp. tritici CRL 75-36-700-3]|uniref:DNA 3'-5' helicase n=1 Tax=Puccinia graminis f. sp. tritici (strain CRL 75-36-700-3 / race SCCL) TaxID=418459 RepID=E3KGC7_PUCGT|nr:uncharacterized protein PGTG_08538 [Puccinia graminis f. sp. tritici CRL 75-36-700-3]EFP83352.2 hypothetical protein PGTG_08538 [Puccinia graminis f. sp. tritici CRL 75-36-700-3]